MLGSKRVLIDLLGETIGKLRVAARAKNRGTVAYWVCQCACGKTIEASAGNLLSGKTRTCGCSRTRHGSWKTPEYVAWRGMRQRCCNTKHHSYHNYGGRGITVHPTWEDFSVFLQDMGYRPDGGSLERVDNEKGYSPDNCVWATKKEQGRNRRTNKLTKETVFAILQAVGKQSDIAKEFGVSQATISRVKRGECWRG